MRSLTKKASAKLVLPIAVVIVVITSCGPAPSPKTWSYAGRPSKGVELYRLNAGSPLTVCFGAEIDYDNGTRTRYGIIRITGLKPGDQARVWRLGSSAWSDKADFMHGNKVENVLPPGVRLSIDEAFTNPTAKESTDTCKFYGGPADLTVKM